MTATHVEHGSLGPVDVPAGRIWGAKMQLSLKHVSSGDDLPDYPIIKKAAALVNHIYGAQMQRSSQEHFSVDDDIPWVNPRPATRRK
jgi:fumarate hydratase, class II